MVLAAWVAEEIPLLNTRVKFPDILSPFEYFGVGRVPDGRGRDPRL